MEVVLYFAAGIGFVKLIDKLIDMRTNKFTAGEEQQCKNCCFKKAVMESLDDEQA